MRLPESVSSKTFQEFIKYFDHGLERRTVRIPENCSGYDSEFYKILGLLVETKFENQRLNDEVASNHQQLNNLSVKIDNLEQELKNLKSGVHIVEEPVDEPKKRQGPIITTKPGTGFSMKSHRRKK